METTEPRGLRGWLILVGIGLVVAPLRLIAANYPLYSTIFVSKRVKATFVEGRAAPAGA